MNNLDHLIQSLQKPAYQRTQAPILMGDWLPYKNAASLDDFLKRAAHHPSFAARSFYLALPLTEVKRCSQKLPDAGICFGSNVMHSVNPGSFTENFSLKLQQLHQAAFVYLDATDENGGSVEEINLKLQQLLMNDMPAVLKIGESRDLFFQGRTGNALQSLLQRLLAQIAQEKLDKLIIVYKAPWLGSLGMQMMPRHTTYACSLLRETLSSFLDPETAFSIRVAVSIPEFCKDFISILTRTNAEGLFFEKLSLYPDNFLLGLESLKQQHSELLKQSPAIEETTASSPISSIEAVEEEIQPEPAFEEEEVELSVSETGYPATPSEIAETPYHPEEQAANAAEEAPLQINEEEGPSLAAAAESRLQESAKSSAIGRAIGLPKLQHAMHSTLNYLRESDPTAGRDWSEGHWDALEEVLSPHLINLKEDDLSKFTREELRAKVEEELAQYKASPMKQKIIDNFLKSI